MPLYDYKCSVCERSREVMLKLADIDSRVYCMKCGCAMNRKISAVFVRGDYPPYECPVTSKIIEGRVAHEENLKRTGCRLLEPGETEAYKHRMIRADSELEQKLEETADQFISSLPTDARDRLAGEMEGGLDATIERSTPKF